MRDWICVEEKCSGYIFEGRFAVISVDVSEEIMSISISPSARSLIYSSTTINFVSSNGDTRTRRYTCLFGLYRIHLIIRQQHNFRDLISPQTRHQMPFIPPRRLSNGYHYHTRCTWFIPRSFRSFIVSPGFRVTYVSARKSL